MFGALKDVKVLELGAWVAAPGAGAVLGDWGAEVIKIEDPVTGDPIRGWKSIRGVKVTDIHFWFELFNRNKKSLGLDLRSDTGREILYRLVKDADVFLTNFKGSVLKKLKVEYHTLSELNPRLVYGFVSGYGKNGKDVEKPGYDITAFWARGGILCHMAPEGKPPIMPPMGAGDTIVGTFMAGAISAALFNREKTGSGQEVDLSLYHSAVWTSAMDVEAVLHKGTSIPQVYRTMLPNPLENEYWTKDGKWLRVAMIQSDRFWPSFCKALGIEHLARVEKYKDAASREANATEIISILDEVFITKNCSEWVKIFEANGLICDTIQPYTDIADDPQALENGFFVDVEHPSGITMKLVASPINFGKTPSTVRTSAPELGQHTEEILLEAGYTWDELVSFKEKGAIS